MQKCKKAFNLTGTCQTNALTPAAGSTITHAVSSKSGDNSYTYDCNAIAIARGDQTLIYSLSGIEPHQAYARVQENPARENRLVEVQVNSVTVAEYVYDGDGNQVKAVVTGGDLTITTVFVGSYYEQITTMDASVTPAVTTTAWKKYYYAGAVRLAMREDSDDPLYLIGDHLGSTSLVLDTAGQEVAKQSYLPFGETWGVSAADLPTDFTFTGQREAAEIGLMYYVARWYDTEIGHFIQADTIVPGAENVLAWKKYAYVEYNPLRYTDPTGHMVDEEGSYNPWNKTVRTDDSIIELPYISVSELVSRQSLVEPIVAANPVDLSLYPGGWSFPNNDKPPIDLSDYTMIESGPIVFSIFLETGIGLGESYVIGVEYYTDFNHDYFGAYFSDVHGVDIGGNISLGMGLSNDDFFSYTNGGGASEVFIGGNVTTGVGGTIAISPDLSGASIAFSLGFRYAAGYQLTERPYYIQLD